MAKPVLNIGVFQNWGMGDLIMTTPVITELHRTFPQAKLWLIVRGKAQAALLKEASSIHQILEMPPNEKKADVFKFFWSLRRLNLDAVYVGTRITPTAAFLLRYVSGIKPIIGDGERLTWLYDVRNRLDPAVHRVDRMLQTLSMWTGRPIEQAVFDLPINPAGIASGSTFLQAQDLQPKGYVAIHAGGSKGGGQDKRLPPALVRDTIAMLQGSSSPMPAVLIFGPDDKDLLPQFTPPPDGSVIVSNVSLDETKYILSKARTFIGTDSGLGHIAAAYGVPTITVAGPTNPIETRPYGPDCVVVRSLEEFTCRPCWFTKLQGNCPYDVRCMRTINPEQLLSAISPEPPGVLVKISL